MLRPRREWPCRCRAAEQRYEVAPPQVEHAASSPGATAIIRPPSDVLAQSVCRTSNLPMEVSTVFGADLNCSESRRSGPTAMWRRAAQPSETTKPAPDSVRAATVLRHNDH